MSPNGNYPPGYYQRQGEFISPVAPSPNSLMFQMSPTQPTGMFTRNLIGSLAASASRLIDPSDKIGIWFILQDLSVRTEGSFR